MGVFGLTALGFLSLELWSLGGWHKPKQIEAESIETPVRSEVLVGEAEIVSQTEEGNSQMVVADDARPLIIEKYLTKYKSPLAPYSKLILELSQTYGFDYKWILAIGQQESNLCKKIPEGSYNCWGYGIHKKGTLKFDSYEAALRSYAEYLDRVYFKKGLNTPELVMKKYCPHSDGSWAFAVRHFMDDIESGEF